MAMKNTKKRGNEIVSLLIDLSNDRSGPDEPSTDIFFGFGGAQILPGSNLNFTLRNIDIKHLFAFSFKMFVLYIENCYSICFHFRENLNSIDDVKHAELKVMRFIRKGKGVLHNEDETIKLPLRYIKSFASKDDVKIIADKIKDYIKRMRKIEKSNAT